MIEWKPFNKKVAAEEIKENMHLILMKSGDIAAATHDAMQRWFIRELESESVIYSYSNITHYAEINWPEVKP